MLYSIIVYRNTHYNFYVLDMREKTTKDTQWFWWTFMYIYFIEKSGVQENPYKYMLMIFHFFRAVASSEM